MCDGNSVRFADESEIFPSKCSDPADPFIILDPQNALIDELCVVKKNISGL